MRKPSASYERNSLSSASAKRMDQPQKHHSGKETAGESPLVRSPEAKKSVNSSSSRCEICSAKYMTNFTFGTEKR